MKEKYKKFIKKYFGDHFFFYLKMMTTLFKDYSNKYYSQFGEDAVLRVLVNSGERPGFYVDVGAYHPKHLSNTYFFYKKGWRGINIDPNPRSIKLFNLLRPTDINLNVAIANGEGGGKIS